MTADKIAVVLMNLGGPAGEKDIEPFLFNFFMDENIISAPTFIRYFIAKWISWKRSRGAAKKAYGYLGGISPLLENTKAQARSLEDSLKKELPNARVFVSMRYWHPFAEETIKAVLKFQPHKIILLPLYPQFSTATSKSSLQNWHKKFKELKIYCETIDVCCYPENEGFIKASAELILEEFKKAPPETRLLFSAHGLPERTIKKGDPYQNQCEKTAAAIIKELNIPSLDWQMCYQSRVGRLKWIGPSAIDALNRAAIDKKSVVIYPLAFVSEHVETMVEINIEYRHMAEKLKIPCFFKVSTVGTHPSFINGLKEIVLSYARGKNCDNSCGDEFKQCYRKIKNV